MDQHRMTARKSPADLFDYCKTELKYFCTWALNVYLNDKILQALVTDAFRPRTVLNTTLIGKGRLTGRKIPKQIRPSSSPINWQSCNTGGQTRGNKRPRVQSRSGTSFSATSTLFLPKCSRQLPFCVVYTPEIIAKNFYRNRVVQTNVQSLSTCSSFDKKKSDMISFIL